MSLIPPLNSARALGALIPAVLVLGSSGCIALHGKIGQPLDPAGRWALLPIRSYAEVSRVGERVEAILSTLLRSRGIEELEIYADHLEPRRLPELDERRRYERALEWAREGEFDYLITGTVTEWQYKSGLDAEPVVGLGLEVQDFETGEVLFSTSGARTGWSRGSLSGTAQNLLEDLLGLLVLEEL